MLSKRSIILCIIFLLWFPSLAPASDAAFLPGEKLIFQLRWEFVPAGEATLSVDSMTVVDGEPAYHFVLTAKSNSFVDMFYKVRDQIDSYTDVDMTRSVYFSKNQREGKTRGNATITFDWDNNTAQYTTKDDRRDPVELQPGAFDPLGIFYFVRSSDLEPGIILERPVTDGKKCVIGIGHVIKRETIKVPAGTFDTLLIEPDTKDVGGVFEKSKDAKIHIWVTADKYHIPVKLQSKVVVGSFMGELTEVHLPDAP